MAVNPLVDDVDHIILMGQKSPGKAIVSGGKLPTKWDEQAGAGAGGATLAYGGPGIADFDVQIQLFTREHFLEWEIFRELLKAPKKTDPKTPVVAMDLRHPYVDELGANAVVLTERSQLHEIGETLWAVDLKFKQYRKPAPVLGNSKANGTITNPDGSTPGAKATEEEEMIAAATIQNSALNAIIWGKMHGHKGAEAFEL